MLMMTGITNIDVPLVSTYLHSWKQLRFGLDFGKERVGSDTAYDHHFNTSHKDYLVRASVSYDFHVGRFGVVPTLALDSVDGETATVAGDGFVMPF